MNMHTDAFLTGLYVIVDDWYLTQGVRLLSGKVGAKPVFSDSEVMTLALAHHWCGFRSEREWLRYVSNHHADMFPHLLSQSEFNRRARNLCWLLNQLRLYLLNHLGVLESAFQLIDGTPIHVRHWRRYGPGHLTMEHAALGHCAAKKETFYGYRLVLLTTRDGVITNFALLPGDADEREGAMDLLIEAYGLRVLGDKGFIDKAKQEWLREHRAVQLYTPKRKNQQEQNPEGWDALLNRVRRGIETTYAQAKGGFNLERPGARTFWGLCSRLIAKLTGMTIAAWSNVLKGRSPLELAGFSF